MVVCWPFYAVGSVVVAARPRLVSFLFPLFRVGRVQRALVGAAAASSGASSSVGLPLHLDPWSLVELGKAIHLFRASSELDPPDRRSAQQRIARLLVEQGRMGASRDVGISPDRVTDAVVAEVEESVMRRSVFGVTQVSLLARVVSGVGWFGAVVTIAPAIASVRFLLRPILRPLGRFIPPPLRWLVMYYMALHLTAAPRLADVQRSRPRCIFYSVAGCGMAWGLMVLEETSRARRLRFARQAERWEQSRWQSGPNPFESRDTSTSDAMMEALEWRRQVQGQDRQRAVVETGGADDDAQPQMADRGDDMDGLELTLDDVVGPGFQTFDWDNDEHHVSHRNRKLRQLAKYAWMALTSGIPALTCFSRTLGLFSSGAAFIGLCSAEAWLLSDSDRQSGRRGDRAEHEAIPRPRLAYPSAPAIMWLAKHGIRFVAPRCGARLAAFDVGVSIFGPLALNVIALFRSRGEWCGKLFCLLELVAGVGLGNDELLVVGSMFAVPFAIADIVSIGNRVPLLVFVASSSAVYGGSSMLGSNNEQNRVRAARILGSALLVS